jgi:3-dehydroquinate dehydratase / shikimate dehydrogenase
MENNNNNNNNGNAAAAAAADAPAAGAADAPPPALPDRCLVAVSCTSPQLPNFLAEIKEIASSGADLVELRLDLLADFDPAKDLDTVLDAAKKAGLPYIVTCRAAWEGGAWRGGEPQRLATLKLAALKGAPFVDVEYKAAHMFFAGELFFVCFGLVF